MTGQLRRDARPAVRPGEAVLVALVGAGIQASRTPAMHEREGAEHGLRYVYRLLDLEIMGLGVEALPELLTAAKRFGFAGLNVTYPCKQAVIAHLDGLSAEAEALGAVNTIVFCGGRSIGHNSDGWGFAESSRRELADVPRARVVQLGAGGAGAAVAHALLTLGTSELRLADVDTAKAESLARSLRARFDGARVVTGSASEMMAGADGIVNATPIGMKKYPGLPLRAELLHPDLWVADIVYFPLETELLRTARALGCRTMGGGGMAVFQAAAAFRLFCGIEPDAERMMRHFVSMTEAAT